MEFSLYSVTLVRRIGGKLTRQIHLNTICLKNYYESLEISSSATQGEIKNAYYKLSKLYHPDIAENKEENLQRFREISVAYDVLGNIKSRKLYDKGAFIKGNPDQKVDSSRTSSVKNTNFTPTSNMYQYGRSFTADDWIKQQTSLGFEREKFQTQIKGIISDETERVKSESDGVVFFAGLGGTIAILAFLFYIYDIVK